MMSNRTWNYWVAAAFLLGGLTVVMFNYFVDPYEVFGPPYLRSGYAVNERFRKVNHLLHNESHDSYILGSSVMGVFDPDVANRITGHSFYNLSFLAGTPQEAFDTLRGLKRHGKPIKEVLIGIDFYQFYERPRISPTNRPHPAVSGESWLSFYSSYLFASGLWQGLTRIAHHLQSQPSIFFDVDGTGMYHLYEYDRSRASNAEQYNRDHFQPNAWNRADIHWVEERFVEFAELCKWLDENQIDAKLFIHPFYRDTLSTISDKSYLEFKARLLKIRPDIVDFSVARDITQDKSWYYDKRHYRAVAADMIMAVMFQRGDTFVVPGKSAVQYSRQ